MIAYPRIYQAVFGQPWLIQPAAHAAIVNVLNSRLFGDRPQLSADALASIGARENKPEVRAGQTWLESSGRFAPAFVDSDGIATVFASGVIAKGASAFEKSCFGGVGPDDIEQALAACMGNDLVRGIILKLTSPGGIVSGIAEAGEAVASIQEGGKKLIDVFAEDLCCSAAFWIAAGARAIWTNQNSCVGSVGVYVPSIDYTEQAAMEGVRVTLIKDGKHKGAGYPGTALSPEDEALIQDEVNQIGAAFRAHVLDWRPIEREDLEGQSFLPAAAIAKGFCDGLVRDLAECKALLLSALR